MAAIPISVNSDHDINDIYELSEEEETNIIDETAWDLFHTSHRPQHDVYDVGPQITTSL